MKELKRVAIATLDGGAGKTALAFALAKELDFYLISNDDSVIEMAYPKMAKIMKNPKIIDDVIYDFGGFADAGVIDIIKHCDIVIVPCINDLNSKMKAIKTIKELSQYNDNFLVVATRLETATDKNKINIDFKEVKEAIHKEFKNIPVLPLRKTKMLKNALEFGNSPLELVAESKKVAWDGRAFIPEYKEILRTVINNDDRFNNLVKEKMKGN